MRYLDEFRDPELARKLARKIKEVARGGPITLMEVCGTHTMAIAKSGIRKLLPENLRLISGPGCPVCVTPNAYIDRAISLSRREDVLVASFGDMLRVPGSSASLEQARAQGGKVAMVYSPKDALALARENPGLKIVFLAVGFETTSPTIAATILQAEQQDCRNFFILPGHKLIPPAMAALVQNRKLRINGFICPAHVSAIIGAGAYGFLAREYGIPCVVAGFEPLDVLSSILALAQMVVAGKPEVKNLYARAATEAGNRRAQELLGQVFAATDSEWRGLGVILESGYALQEKLQHRDAEKAVPVEVEPTRQHKGCKCGEVLQGLASPPSCALYGKACTPEKPVGPCMVSSEGACAAHYKYGGIE